ncbi:MAG: deoxynucleoside kinase [Myxococcota bacterium]
MGGGRKVIAVAGNMGAGKSSLVDWLHQQFGMTPFFEPHHDNPYLEDFYRDMSRWAFASQTWFLIQRFKIHRDIERRAADGEVVVQDRTIYEDAEIFAAHLHRAGHLSDRDWASYASLYDNLREVLQPPELMIYLRCPLPTLTKRIKKRGRAYEAAVPRRYLKALEDLYETWFATYDASPKLRLDTDRLDYVEHLFDRLELLQAIETHAGVTPLRR